MPLELQQLKFLISSQGERLLERLAHEDLSEANTLPLLTKLRKDYAAEQAGAALEMARLRVKAVDKFGDDAGRMLFTREALEQASDPLVRRYRARIIPTPPSASLRQAQSADSPPHSDKEGEQRQSRESSSTAWESDLRAIRVIDAGCGIGADSLALVAAGGQVLGMDIDPVRVAIARYNAAALGLKARFEVGDIRDGLPDADVVFFDPARRDAAGKRIYDVEGYAPPLSIVRGWRHSLIIVKLSPGVDLAQLTEYGGAIEFISVAGDLKEAVLWLGAGHTGRRATLLVGKNVYQWEGRGLSATNPYKADPTISPPRGWLVEPDPALLRAGLVQDVAAKLNGFLLDETIAYFTTDEKPDSPWVRAWHILDWMPFNLKKLRAYLRERNVGNVTVKKRGSPITPEALIPQLKLRGDDARTLVLTRLRGQPIVMICAPIPG